MKKEKFKLKSRNRMILGTKFITLLLIIILLAISSAYAMFSERLLITGTVTGNITEFTYYFQKPSGWGNTVNAYIWQESPRINPVSWPGTEMTWDSSKNAYKITIANDSAHAHDRIIFNDGTNQTADLIINPYNVNNSIYNPSGVYNPSGLQRISYSNAGTQWSDVYAYFFNNESDVLASWPGIKITNNVLTINTLYAEVARDRYKYVIFNDGTTSNKTDDIFIPSGIDLVYDTSVTNYSWWPCSLSDTNSSSIQRIYVSATFSNFSSFIPGSPVNAYAWKDNSTNNGSWPGQQMTRLDPGNPGSKVYWIDLNHAPGYYVNIIFNTNSGNTQTGDLTLPAQSNVVYTKNWKTNDLTSNGTWTKITMTAPTPTHSH